MLTSSFLLPFFSLATLAAARATLPDPLLATYWGQSSESSLETYCALGYYNGELLQPVLSPLPISHSAKSISILALSSFFQFFSSSLY